VRDMHLSLFVAFPVEKRTQAGGGDFE